MFDSPKINDSLESDHTSYAQYAFDSLKRIGSKESFVLKLEYTGFTSKLRKLNIFFPEILSECFNLVFSKKNAHTEPNIPSPSNVLVKKKKIGVSKSYQQYLISKEQQCG